MDLTSPARAIAPALTAEVLSVLAGTTLPLTGNEISRLAKGGSKAGIFLALQRLEQHGLVDVMEAGNANLYTLNLDHVASEAVLALRDLRGKLFSRITGAINSWKIAPISVAVFGSAARGDGGLNSDIDILIVRPESVGEDDLQWENQIADLNHLVHRWSGNSSSIIQATPTQVASMIFRKEPIVESLRTDAI